MPLPIDTTRKSLPARRGLIFLISQAGATALITQITVTREVLSLAHGNELVIGIVLANWMLLTAWGAMRTRFIRRFSDPSLPLIWCWTLLTILPLLTLIAVRILRYAIYPVGTMLSLTDVTAGSAVLLLPFCVVSGMSFLLLIRTASFASLPASNVYGWESVGSAVAGMLVNLFLIRYLEPFQILIILSLGNGASLVYLFHLRHSHSMSWVVGIGFTLLLVSFFMLNPDLKTMSFLFPGQQISYSKTTPYGHLSITQQEEQYNYYLDNTLLFSSNTPEQTEETAHFAMLQHPHPKRILLLSGGISGILGEILKYPIENIDYVESNPWLIEIGKQSTPEIWNPQVHVINSDARFYVRTSGERYDVILVNVPEPSTIQTNRFYTSEFLRDCKRILSPKGIIAFSLFPAVDYYGSQATALHSIFFSTLTAHFRHIIILPGLQNHFLASDRELHTDIAGRVDQRKLSTLYVNRYYLDDTMVQQRSASIMRSIVPVATINTDRVPIFYQQVIAFWMSYSENNYWLPALILLLVSIIFFRSFNPISIGMFTSGFTLSALQIILMISFQIVYGYVYQALGLIITSCMIGLACGSLLQKRFIPHHSLRWYVAIQIILGVVALLFPVILTPIGNSSVPAPWMQCIFYLLPFCTGTLTGILFGLATRQRTKNGSQVPGELYGLDLFGSALGSFIVSVLLLPLIGMDKVCTTVGFLSVCGGIIAFFYRNRSPVVTQSTLSR